VVVALGFFGLFLTLVAVLVFTFLVPVETRFFGVDFFALPESERTSKSNDTMSNEQKQRQ
jgi:hypothetical protein